MPQDRGKQMLDKVKRSFLRMSTPFEFGGNEIHFNTPLSVNIPPVLARADAAYDRACAILTGNIFAHILEERAFFYQTAKDLLTEAAEKYESALRIIKLEKKRFQAAPIAAYYHFLAGKAAILFALVKGTESLGLDGEIFSDSFGAHIPDSLHAADSLLTECEMNLFHFLEDLLHRTDSHVKDFREKTIKDMSKSDLARYAKAYAEYTVIFSREPYSAAPSREAGTSSGPASAAGRRTPELSKGKSIL